MPTVQSIVRSRDSCIFFTDYCVIVSLAYDYYLGRAGKAHKALHKKYNSDFVVIAPDTISINCVESIDSVFKGKYARGHFYEISAINGDSNLNTTRDYNVHTPGRKVW